MVPQAFVEHKDQTEVVLQNAKGPAMQRKSQIPPWIEVILGRTPAVSTSDALAHEVAREALAAQIKPRDPIEWMFVDDMAYYLSQTGSWRKLVAAIILRATGKFAMTRSALAQPSGQKVDPEMQHPLEAAEVFMDWIGPHERAQECLSMAERKFRDALQHLCEYRQAGGIREVLLAPENKTIEGALAGDAPLAVADGTAAKSSAADLDGTDLVPAGSQVKEHSDPEANG